MRISYNIYKSSCSKILNNINNFNYFLDTIRALIKIYYTCGYNIWRYCIYTDKFFNICKKLISNDFIIITDTNSLIYSIPYNLRFNIKIFSLIDNDILYKFIKKFNCTKSCIQIDIWSILLKKINNCFNIIFIIGTSPTNLIRLIELIKKKLIFPSAIIACPVGLINSKESKRNLIYNYHNIPFVTLRGRLGGITFASSILNSILSY